MKFSVVTPAFNSENTIEDALQSVREQSLSEFEHIVVDDFSSDGTASIVNAHARMDGRIKPINLRRNVGAALARNVGLNCASNDYVVFLDADDVLTPRALQSFAESFETSDYDLIRGQIFRRHKKSSESALNTIGTRRELGKGMDRTDLLLFGDFSTYCYRRRFLDDLNIRFSSHLNMGEDRFFLALCQMYCRSALVIPNVVYEYRLFNSQTVKGTWNKKKVSSYLEFVREMKELLRFCDPSGRCHDLWLYRSASWQYEITSKINVS